MDLEFNLMGHELGGKKANLETECVAKLSGLDAKFLIDRGLFLINNSPSAPHRRKRTAL